MTLDDQSLQAAIAYNQRGQQLFWHRRLPAQHPLWRMNDFERINWLIDFQIKHQLEITGKLRDLELILLNAEAQIDNAITIAGQRIETPFQCLNLSANFSGYEKEHELSPQILCLLSCDEFDRHFYERMANPSQIKAHFSIASGAFQNGHSLLIQWADPAYATPFCPTDQTGDYPPDLACVGVELTGPILTFQRDVETRKYERRRQHSTATLHDTAYTHLAPMPSQMTTLDKLLDVIEGSLDIPRQFPRDCNGFYTQIIDGNKIQSFRGTIAKFHYKKQSLEPGAGLVNALDTLFATQVVDENTPAENDEKIVEKPDIDATITNPQAEALKAEQAILDKLTQQAITTPAKSHQFKENKRYSLKKHRRNTQTGKRNWPPKNKK